MNRCSRATELIILHFENSPPIRSGPVRSGARARLPQSFVTSFVSRLPSALAAADARGREAALPRAARVHHPEVELNKTVRSRSRLARPTRSTRPFLTKMPIPPSVCTCRTRVRRHESATVPTREHGREQKKTLRLLRQPTSDQLLSTYIARAGDMSAYASCQCIIRFSDRSKARRRCRHAPDTSHGSSAGRSDAGDGRRVRIGTAGVLLTVGVAFRTCGLVKLWDLWICGLMGLVKLWIVDLLTCGLVGLVGLFHFWTCGTCGFWNCGTCSLVDIWICGTCSLVDIWICGFCGTCGLVGLADMWDLWTCELVICGLGRTASSFTTEGTTLSMQDRTVATAMY